MKLRIISVGHKMPAWVETACAEYIKRMPRELPIEMIDIKPEKRAAGKNTQNVQESEAKRIIDTTGKDKTKHLIVACDERGEEINTLQLAEKLLNWQSVGKDINIIVGGADGLHASIKQSADFVWGLSKLTLAHAFVRVLLCEQLYRAHSVKQNHPYHRE